MRSRTLRKSPRHRESGWRCQECFFGLAHKHTLNQIMQARGHLVVILSADRFRRDAERPYLERFCEAEAFDGIIDCAERYEDLSRFEDVSKRG